MPAPAVARTSSKHSLQPFSVRRTPIRLHTAAVARCPPPPPPAHCAQPLPTERPLATDSSQWCYVQVPFYAATVARARLSRAQQRLSAALKDPGCKIRSYIPSLAPLFFPSAVLLTAYHQLICPGLPGVASFHHSQAAQRPGVLFAAVLPQVFARLLCTTYGAGFCGKQPHWAAQGGERLRLAGQQYAAVTAAVGHHVPAVRQAAPCGNARRTAHRRLPCSLPGTLLTI